MLRRMGDNDSCPQDYAQFLLENKGQIILRMRCYVFDKITEQVQQRFF